MSPVRLEKQDSLAWLYLQRPEAYNTFTQEIADELLEYLFQPLQRIYQGSDYHRAGIFVFSRG